jgi:glycosyltransferase involved in cell wall biosynthesis
MQNKHHTVILTLQAARPGGVPTVVDWWYRYLTAWGHQATVLYAAFDEDQIGFWERVRRTLKRWRVHERPEHPNPTIANPAPPVPLWLFYFVPQWILGSLLNRFDAIVFAGGPVHAALPAALRGMPYILWMGTLYDDELEGKAAVGDEWAAGILKSPFWRFLAWQEAFVIRRAARILPQSPFTMRRIAEKFPEVQGRMELAIVPVDMTIFTPLNEDQRKGEYPYLLNVSRINDPRKNIPLLLEAFRLLLNQQPDLRLVLVGDDPEPPLIALCDQLDLRERVIFEGKVDTERLLALYQRAELFILSSAQEGLGIVMLTALSCGVPVIATDCGGPEGIVVKGVTGLIVPNYDAGALAAAILEFLNDPQKLAKTRETARAFALQNWSEAVVGATLRAHYEDVFHAADIVTTEKPTPKLAAAAAILWSIVVVVAYMQHQAALHWDAIQAQILNPLFNRLP